MLSQVINHDIEQEITRTQQKLNKTVVDLDARVGWIQNCLQHMTATNSVNLCTTRTFLAQKY